MSVPLSPWTFSCMTVVVLYAVEGSRDSSFFFSFMFQWPPRTLYSPTLCAIKGHLAVWLYGHLAVWKGVDDCHDVAFSSQCRSLSALCKDVRP